MAKNSLSSFLSPKGVAVVGASTNPTKLGYGLARNLVQSNYQGVVHFINPKGGSLFGRPLYSSIAEVPDPVDLGILLIPASAVPHTLHECGQRGLRSVIIGSGGFRETGKEGAALERACVEIAKQYGMRLMGPNCIGLLDTHLPIDATFLPPPGPTPGDVAFISHSGAICAAVIDWASGQGFGLSRLVSLGNQADLTETDILSAVADDPYTRVLSLYLEGVSNGRRFVSEARDVARRKPVIALKVGRYDSGRKAVASHTGALAGKESAYNAAFRRAGVVRAESSEEMFNWARALAWCPLPQGRRMAVLTNAGGPGVTAADAIEANRLNLAELLPETLQGLAACLPDAASLSNPVDMLASASPEDYTASLRLLLRDPGVDGVLVILVPPPMFTSGAVARSMIPVIHSHDKPVVIALMGERMIQEAVEYFRAARIPEYRFPESAASALAILAQRSEFLKRDAEGLAEAKSSGSNRSMNAINPGIVAELLEKCQTGLDGFLSLEEAQSITAAYGIPVPKVELAQTAEEAGRLASSAGGAVVLKVASPDVTHKSDVGGVLLGLEGEQAAFKGFNEIVKNVQEACPGASIEGVYVQPMVPAGQEVIVGAVQDPQFGPLMMFGSGGIEVEGLKDVEFELAPLSRSEAARMLDATWAGRKLNGYRSLAPADRDAVVDVLRRVAQLASDFPQLSEIEINPLRVLGIGEGVMAVDIRVRVSPTGAPAVEGSQQEKL
jgi:acetate---CoA ligase (ADP-forming)